MDKPVVLVMSYADTTEAPRMCHTPKYRQYEISSRSSYNLYEPVNDILQQLTFRPDIKVIE